MSHQVHEEGEKNADEIYNAEEKIIARLLKKHPYMIMFPREVQLEFAKAEMLSVEPKSGSSSDDEQSSSQRSASGGEKN
jgi:hypothetical protein